MVDSGTHILSLLALAARLSKEHNVHEGKKLKYSFLFGYSSMIWPIVEQTISDESKLAQRISQSANVDFIKNLAEILSAHWSIFQNDRVFALVDLTRMLNNNKLAVSKIIKVRPPVNWNGSFSHLANDIATTTYPSCVVHADGNGRVKLYSMNQYLCWNPSDNTFDTKSNVEKVLEEIKSVLDGENREIFLLNLKAALEDISDIDGEGCLLILINDNDENKLRSRISTFIKEMDDDDLKMSWRKDKYPEWLFKTTLRSMFILDGATMISLSKQGNEIKPRIVAYPHFYCEKWDKEDKCKYCEFEYGPNNAFSVSEFNEETKCRYYDFGFKNNKQFKKVILNKLIGKGSRHLGAANLGMLLYNMLGNKNNNFAIITVSGDGPLNLWPNVLIKQVDKIGV